MVDPTTPTVSTDEEGEDGETDSPDPEVDDVTVEEDDAGLFDGEDGEEHVDEEKTDTGNPDGSESIGKDDIDEDYVELDTETAELFDGVDEGSGSEVEDDEDPLDDDVVTNALEGESNEFGDAYVEGMAKLMLVGLDDEDERGQIEDELVEAFQTFRLNHFAGRVWEEKMMAEHDTDIDPVWGLVGSTILCIVYGVYRRPDGNEKVKQAIDTIKERT